MLSSDTICALSSSGAPAARGVVRLSGAGAWTIGGALWSGPPFTGGTALDGSVRLPVGEVPGWVYAFAAPRSYTGEDQLEFHLPGNPLLLRMLLDVLVASGARPAEPGEFTARAYFNRRLDLTAAEGVAAIVSAENEQELQAGRQLLAGELARRLGPILELLAQTLSLIELGIDFSEEDVNFLSADDLANRIGQLDQALGNLLADSQRFERLAHEPSIVLVGRPNAGKSSLLNALSNSERAVVSDTPGTTRDALSAEIVLERGLVRLIDVAGLDEQAHAPLDLQMHQRALRILEESDAAVLVVDAADPRKPMSLPRAPDLLVRTKSDLRSQPPGAEGLWVSAHDGEGLDALRARLDRIAFGDRASGGTLALNQRHVGAIQRARATLSALPMEVADDVPELLAADLRTALDELGGILGEVTPDDILGKIFSSFCIGK